MSASGVTAGASASAGAESAPAARTEVGYEVRWDEGQKLFRVWNPVSNMWVSAPGFADERIAKVVAEGLTNPPQARRGSAEASKRG